MSYLELLDSEVSAYAPVSSRLLTQLRDNALAVRTMMFHGPSTAVASLGKSFGDPDTATDPPTVYHAIDEFHVWIPGEFLSYYGGQSFVRLFCRMQWATGATTAGVKNYLRLRETAQNWFAGPILRTGGSGYGDEDFSLIFRALTAGWKTFRWEVGIWLPAGVSQNFVKHVNTDHRPNWLEPWPE